MFFLLSHEVEELGDIKGFAPDIMKLLENNHTDDFDYGYGIYIFFMRHSDKYIKFLIMLSMTR